MKFVQSRQLRTGGVLDGKEETIAGIQNYPFRMLSKKFGGNAADFIRRKNFRQVFLASFNEAPGAASDRAICSMPSGKNDSRFPTREEPNRILHS